LPAKFFLAFLLLKYRKRQVTKTTAAEGTITAMTIIVVLLLSAKTRILCCVRDSKD